MTRFGSLTSPPCLGLIGVAVTFATGLASSAGAQGGWGGYALNAQHTALSPVPTQSLKRILWQTPVDLQPQYSGPNLLIHYGSPLITARNTVLVPVKTEANNGFQVEAHNGHTGALLWKRGTDYEVPPHNWTPSFGCTLTPDGRFVMPGGGGTVIVRTNPDQATGSVSRIAFYGLDSYNANIRTYLDNVKISTPITSDKAGNLYFGFVVLGATPTNLSSGIARISSTGAGSWISAGAAANDPGIKKVAYNCAPALSLDGATLYVGVNSSNDSGFTGGYLLALDSKTLQQKARVRLKDVATPNNDAVVPDDGTATPTVGPDGDVYYGVLENPFYSNHLRGWLLHFSGDLATSKTPGAFGWDDSASVVPASAVPSYQGGSAYLLLTKYNNYVEGHGDGVNRVAILDPNGPMVDPISNATVMKEVMTVAGPTPDDKFVANYPNAVREWCINTAVIDPFTKSALINNEDGKLYRWDFTANRVTEVVTLTGGIGEAYTPTIAGPDGTVYAINNAILFAVGQERVTISGTVDLPGAVDLAQTLAFELRPLDGTVPLSITQKLTPNGAFTLTDVPARGYNLAVKGGKWLRTVKKGVDASGGAVSGVAVSLVPGDLDDDNVIGLEDLVTFFDSYGSVPGDANWNPNADLSCDDQVELDDLSLFFDNYGKEGDP